MVEKPLDGARQIDRHELMPDAARQPPGEQPRRGHGSGRQQDFDAGALGQHAVDQRQHRMRFADAGGMDPDQLPRGRSAPAIP